MPDKLEQNVSQNRLANVRLNRLAVTRDGREVYCFKSMEMGEARACFSQGSARWSCPAPVLKAIGFAKASPRFLSSSICEGAEGEILEWICANRSGLPGSLRVACKEVSSVVLRCRCRTPRPVCARTVSRYK